MQKNSVLAKVVVWKCQALKIACSSGRMIKTSQDARPALSRRKGNKYEYLCTQ
jgi:hypothetical protein